MGGGCSDPRFQIGITSKSDGQMMFLLDMLSKMKPVNQSSLGSRIASVHNGSSLFNSDAGMVAIRKYIIENDYLEAIIALPTNMFYNTGIPTFIWIITNNKIKNKKGKVQLINATSNKYYSKLKKSIGSKQNELSITQIELITNLFLNNINNQDSIVLDNEDLGYILITIEKPKSIKELLENEKFNNLKYKNKILEKLKALESNPRDFKDQEDFISFLEVPLTKQEAKLIINSDKNTNTEKIPLKIDIKTYFEEEIKPHSPNSWIDYKSKSIGYEILFNKYFYTFTPPRDTEEIKEELIKLKQEIANNLNEILQ